MTDIFDFLEDELDYIDKHGLRRSLKCIDSIDGPEIRFRGENDSKILFCSNNYLNIAGDPAVNLAAKEAVDKYGTGSPSSRLISGTMAPHVEVEREFARFFKKDAAILFTSGWVANQALLTCLPQRGDIVLLDKLDHASIIDGAKSSEAAFRTYRRDNAARLEKYLADGSYLNKFIVTESVFSMDGDMADLETLVKLKNKYNAILIVDEAHAAGCMGPRGAGLADELGLLGEVDIIVSPLGKAFGASGCIIAGPEIVVDYIVNTSRAFIYTTAPSPVTSAAILAALQIVKTEPQRRQILLENSRVMRQKLRAAGFDTGQSLTHIIPIIIGNASDAVRISDELFENGYFAVAIRPPTVMPGTSRIRISMQTQHTENQINKFVKKLSNL